MRSTIAGRAGQDPIDAVLETDGHAVLAEILAKAMATDR